MPRRCLLVLLIVICSALIASGQSRRGGFDPADRLRALDRNNDGKLEDEEIPARFRPFLMRRFKEAGLDTSRPIDIDAYLEGRSDEDDRRTIRRTTTGSCPVSE